MNPYSSATLLEDRIRAASPAGLTLILLEESVNSANMAMRAIEDADPRARAKAVNRMLEILTELTLSLRPEVSPEAGRRKAIYFSLQQLIIEGHASATVRPFQIAHSALTALLEDWRNVCRLLEGSSAPAVVAEEPEQVATPRNPYEMDAFDGSDPKRRWTL